MATSKPRFFATPAAWRAWLQKHHDTEDELLVGFHKRGSGEKSITWPESVDEALCFGWIDGVRRSLGETSYSIRFTPRRKTSIWSAVNVARVAELTREGRMHEAGQRAFAARSASRTAVYSFERTEAPVLGAEHAARLAASPAALAFFEAQAPWYRRTATHWVLSAKQEATRERRFATLLADSAAGRRIKQLSAPARAAAPVSGGKARSPTAPRRPKD